MSESRIVCYNAPINMRLSEKSLAALVSEHGHDLNSGDVFIFFNSKHDQCKIAWNNGAAFCSIDKKLESGTFADKKDIQISDSALQSLLDGGFFGSGEMMSALQRAVRGKIVHISAARSANHLR